MLIEFETPPKFNFHTFFAEALGVPIVNNEFKIPHWLGVGSVRRVDLGEDYKLTICHYRLKEDLVLKRIGSKEPAAHLGIIFYNHEEPASLVTGDGEQRYFSRYNDMAIRADALGNKKADGFPHNVLRNRKTRSGENFR
jgi:hypothetical protein